MFYTSKHAVTICINVTILIFVWKDASITVHLLGCVVLCVVEIDSSAYEIHLWKQNSFTDN